MWNRTVRYNTKPLKKSLLFKNGINIFFFDLKRFFFYIFTTLYSVSIRNLIIVELNNASNMNLTLFSRSISMLQKSNLHILLQKNL
jgi:hypothetical protein